MKKIDPVKVPGYDEFYEIPNYSRYGVSKDGRVLNKLTNKELSGSVNPDGYHNFRLTDDLGYCYTYGRHRLLCDVFKADSKKTQIDIVNHRNGVKGDDRLDNLEWTTYQGNIEHAGANGLTTKCSPISVRDVDTGEVKKYSSIIAAARDLGMTKDAIVHRVRIGEKRIFPERKQYRSSHEDDPWYDVKDIESALLENGNTKSVVTRNVITGVIKPYKKITDLANELGVSSAAITMWLNRENQPVLPGYIQLKWWNDETPWRTVEDPHLEIAEFTGKKPVVTVNEETGEKRFYSSAIECARVHGLKPTALNHRLKSNGSKVFTDGIRYGYYPWQSTVTL